MDNDKEDKSKPSKSEDEALWDYMMRDVTPLDKGLTTLSQTKTPKRRSTHKKASVPRDNFPAMPCPPRTRNTTIKAPPQIDRRTDERLRKGQMPIEARLDMHGMTQIQAFEALQRFLQTASANGFRCVLVITGKGLVNRDPLAREEGVLKARLPEWLAERPLKDIVLKSYPAKPKDGGSGAAYLYLRRKR